MHRTNRILVLIFAALLFSLICNNSAAAQSNEVALTVGGYFPVSLSAANSFAVEGNVAHRILHVPLAAVYVEVPIAGTTGSQSNELIAITCVISGCPPIANNYTALFVTPGLKLKLAPSFPISPYVAAGVGLAHFNTTYAGSTTSQTSNSAAFDIGGGLDIKIFPFFSLRGEIRDFNSGVPNGFILTSRENQVLATAGLVFRF